MLLLGVRGQDGGGLADLHPGVECCDLWLLLIMLRAPDNAAPDVLIASGQLQLLKLVASINTGRLINYQKRLSRSMIIAHFIYRSGQCWLEHAKDFYLEMSGPPARSWPGVTRLLTAGRASRLRPNARRNLRRTIASQAELGAERQNSRCYSSMTGSLQKTTFFQTSFANCFLRSALCPPRPDWHLPGEIVSAAENIY